MTISRTKRWVQWVLSLALFLVGCIITFIVFRGPLQEASNSGLERRKEVVPDDVQRIRVPGIGSLEYQRLFEVVSEPGESLDAFALRIGPRLRAYSDATGYEACGVLATDGDRFGVVIGTNRAHIACANFASKVPQGMRPTVETIHSHGTDRAFSANRNDKTLSPQQMAGGRGGIRSVAGQRLDAFSSTDYYGGPGYLATPDGVIHQAGEGTARMVDGQSQGKLSAGNCG